MVRDTRLVSGRPDRLVTKYHRTNKAKTYYHTRLGYSWNAPSIYETRPSFLVVVVYVYWSTRDPIEYLYALFWIHPFTHTLSSFVQILAYCFHSSKCSYSSIKNLFIVWRMNLFDIWYYSWNLFVYLPIRATIVGVKKIIKMIICLFLCQFWVYTLSIC